MPAPPVHYLTLYLTLLVILYLTHYLINASFPSFSSSPRRESSPPALQPLIQTPVTVKPLRIGRPQPNSLTSGSLNRSLMDLGWHEEGGERKVAFMAISLVAQTPKTTP